MADIDQPSRRGNARVRCKKLSTRIDMTPMVDLAFLLLTFFILTTSLMKVTVMEVVVPEKREEQETLPSYPASRVLTFIVDENDKLFWRRGITDALQTIEFSHQVVNKLLVSKNAEITKMLVLIKATNRSHYKSFVDILDELSEAKINRYCIVDVTSEDEALIKNARN